MQRAKSPMPILLLGLLLPIHGLRAQTGSMRVTVPSPTAASLGRFGDVPVDLHTGIPDISIPLFTVKGRTLELPIVLRYHAGGIRVEEIGSWVGLGWSLDAGGTISRTVRGLVDDSPSGYLNTGHHFYVSGNWPSPPLSLLDNIKDGYVDGDPDQFFYSVAGRSGQFVIGPTDSTGTKEYRTIPYQKLKIVPTFSGGEITAWSITTEDGTEYTFAAREVTTDQSIMNPASELGSHLGESHGSAWHLTKIRAPGGDSITLYYSTYIATHRQGYYREEFSQVSDNCVPGSLSVTNEYRILAQRLDSIKSAVHTIKFSTGAELRSDALSPSGVKQEPRLDRITVTTPTGKVLRIFQFEHDYFPGNRLRLKNVYEKDASGNSLPPYTFTYYPGTLPSRGSNAQDHWGFYNGRTGNSTPIPTVVVNGFVLPGANREPDPDAMQVGILKRITYPTGGYSEFVYEANDYGAIGESGTMPIGEGPEQEAEVSSNLGEGLKSQTFTVGGTETVVATVYVSLDPENCAGQDWPPCPYVKLGTGGWDESGTYYVTLEPGTYTIQASDEENPQGYASITVRWRDRAPVGKKLAGGLRIAELRTVDGMGNTSIRKYRYVLQSDSTRSSGIVHVEPRYHYTFSEPTCKYVSRSSMSKLPLGGGPPVEYREVTVLHGANGEYGRTRHTFRSIMDAADGMPVGEWPYLTWTSVSWKRGQPLEVVDYNAGGAIQRRTASTYRFRDEDNEQVTTRRFRGMSILSWPGLTHYDTEYFFADYQVISAWAYKDTETTVQYNEAGSSSVSTVRTFVYGNPVHAQLTEVRETNSDGTERITRMKYPADYATGTANAEAAALTEMQGAAHMHSPVIERWVVEKRGSTEKVIEAVLRTYKIFAPGQILPFQRFVLNPGSQP
ncbi:MAG TPA: hypothetical protein VF188_16855 [Longimicrobiales bacterium]